jgi:hypothetical protein
MSRAARRFDRIIASETGMYFVVPAVVPDVTAKNGMRPGQVMLSRCGKCGCHQSRQKSS